MKPNLTLLVALLLVPPATRYANRTLPEVPRFGKLGVGFFQALEEHSTQVSNAWN